MRIGIIGTGTIAAALVTGIAADGHTIAVSHRGKTHSEGLVAAFANVCALDNQQVLDRSDTVFIGLMAEAAPEALAGLRFRPDQCVISLMAGAALAQVVQMVAPARMAAVMIPFPGIAQGGSPIMVLGDAGPIDALFGQRNQIFRLSDAAELAAYMCAQAVLSPAVSMVGEAAGWLAARVADPEQAETFLRRLVGSNLAAQGCAPLLAALSTPGGYNLRLRNHMADSGMDAALQQGLDRLEQDR